MEQTTALRFRPLKVTRDDLERWNLPEEWLSGVARNIQTIPDPVEQVGDFGPVSVDRLFYRYFPNWCIWEFSQEIARPKRTAYGHQLIGWVGFSLYPLASIQWGHLILLLC